MGNTAGHVIDAFLHPETAPDFKNPPTFDPNLGFPNGRKERVMVATEEELIKYNLPLDKRDYCAHLYINWLKCRKETFPLLYQCDHNKHQYSECEFDDFVLRMKEYERERRLKKRAKRIKAKQLVEEME